MLMRYGVALPRFGLLRKQTSNRGRDIQKDPTITSKSQTSPAQYRNLSLHWDNGCFFQLLNVISGRMHISLSAKIE